MEEYSKFHGNSVKHNYSNLRKAIKEHFGKQAVFADAMGLSERSVSLKLNGLRCWTQDEMRLFCDLLRLPYSEIHTYFFIFDVQI